MCELVHTGLALERFFHGRLRSSRQMLRQAIITSKTANAGALVSTEEGEGNARSAERAIAQQNQRRADLNLDVGFVLARGKSKQQTRVSSAGLSSSEA